MTLFGDTHVVGFMANVKIFLTQHLMGNQPEYTELLFHMLAY